MFTVDGYGGDVEEVPQHPHHHQVHRADSEHLEYNNIKILGLRVSLKMNARSQGFSYERF